MSKKKALTPARPNCICFALIFGLLMLILSFPVRFFNDVSIFHRLAGCMQIAGACLVTYSLPKLLCKKLTTDKLCIILLPGCILFFVLLGIAILYECSMLNWIAETLLGIIISVLLSVAEYLEQKANDENNQATGGQ